ncbi:MAG: hypothetical protein ACLFP1_08115 [Candidatus Goldiibacteriota bacterium]
MITFEKNKAYTAALLLFYFISAWVILPAVHHHHPKCAESLDAVCHYGGEDENDSRDNERKHKHCSLCKIISTQALCPELKINTLYIPVFAVDKDSRDHTSKSFTSIIAARGPPFLLS